MVSWLNIIGLLFDIVGVIGLYYITDGFMSHISLADIKILSETLSSDPKKSTNDLYNSLSKRYDNGFYKSKENKKRMYFICVIIGFLFQISSSLYPFFSYKETSDKPNKSTTKSASKCYNNCHN
jgi:hypothetical protein